MATIATIKRNFTICFLSSTDIPVRFPCRNDSRKSPLLPPAERFRRHTRHMSRTRLLQAKPYKPRKYRFPLLASFAVPLSLYTVYSAGSMLSSPAGSRCIVGYLQQVQRPEGRYTIDFLHSSH